MPRDGHEPDNLWQCIDAQKRSPAQVSGDKSPPVLYSHDAKQNWVLAVSASLHASRTRPAGARPARKRLEAAIRKSLAANYPHSTPRTRVQPVSRRALFAAAFLLLLSAALTAGIFLRYIVVR